MIILDIINRVIERVCNLMLFGKFATTESLGPSYLYSAPSEETEQEQTAAIKPAPRLKSTPSGVNSLQGCTT